MKYPIDRKEKVVLGGLKQTIHIWGTKKENPVILILHGGPGIPNRYNILEKNADLLADFTLVAWDQRGTGGSYFGCDPASLTLEQLIADGAELIDYLCETLGKKKLFLLGGSWGTELGTYLCRRHPAKIAGYIGYGQVVDGEANEERSWNFCMEKAQEEGDAEVIAELKRVGPPEKGLYKPVFEGLMTQRRILLRYGGMRYSKDKKKRYLKSAAVPILKSKELSLRDKIGVAKGYKLCLSRMWPTIVHYDFIKDEHEFSMPYYIFQGVYDRTTPASLIQAYYDVIIAPDKDLIWFENSAHGPLGEEPEKFKAAMREKFHKIATEEQL